VPNYVPELVRLRGALRASDPATTAQAEAAFAQVVALARDQGSRVLARRAAGSFAHYLRARGRTAEAERLVADVDRALATGTAG
jgi:hypothetical protein